MTWEWTYRREEGDWIGMLGDWRAVVRRVGASRAVWQATLERRSSPRDRYASPTYPDAAGAWSWCERALTTFERDAPVARASGQLV